MKKQFLRKSGIALAGVLSFLFFTSSRPQGQNVPESSGPIYLNTAYSFEERAADLVSRFTLEEKQSLLGNEMAAVPRLGVKVYDTWSEALHGVMEGPVPSFGLEGPTSFSNGVAMGSTWDPELIQRIAQVISDEARAIDAVGRKALTYWSPVVEPVRDPRWGRTGETYGEDPFLVSHIAAGFVRGLMGDDPDYLKIVPTAKHYLANNSEFDRHTSSSNMDSRDLREFYLSPYKKLIEQDNLPSVMASYNAVNGVPTSASSYFLDSIARKTYGMKGYVTGDCGAVSDIYSGHFYAGSAEEAAALALIAGLDSDCGNIYQRYAIAALNEGLMSIDDIDRALVNVFTIRMRTGEFDPPGKNYYSLFPTNTVNAPRNREMARELAVKTPVLLKNETVAGTNGKALPLDAGSLRRIAVLGPHAEQVVLGPYSGRPEPENLVTPLEGIKRYIADRGLTAEVVSSSGANTSIRSNLFYVSEFEVTKINGESTKYDATKYADASPGVIVDATPGRNAQVRSIDNGSWTTYLNVDVVDIDSIGVNLSIPGEGGVIEVRVGTPDGNLIATLEAANAPGTRMRGFGASMRTVKANRLGFTAPQPLCFVYKAAESPEIDKEVIDLARSADVAVIFVGTDDRTASEGTDRISLLLPGNQQDLIKAVSAVNPRTIVVMQTLGAVEVEEFKNLQNVPGIVWVGYNGQFQGEAMARVLFGDVNPGGKLNATWYKSVQDLPVITDYTLRGDATKNGRTFWYFNKDVSYEFGYGLSYTTFAYSNFRISRNAITPNDKITVSVDVTNTGDRDGDEVVQIYMTTPDSPASLQRPIKRLKGFQRVTIPAGQTRTVEIDIDCADLWFWDMQADKISYDPGRYVFEIGSSSKDIRGTVSATMSGTLNAALKVVVAETGKTVMNVGETAQTRVSASMTDDTFYDVSRATVTYTSNHPNVASVDSRGVVTAKGSGVATITAHVTIGGKTVTGSFPVKVMPDLNAASITVNGKTVSGFNPAATQYSYLLKNASAAIPTVGVTTADPSIAAEVVQATGIPGTALITLTDYNSNDRKVYSVNFGLSSAGDEFNGAEVGGQWHWIRENRPNRSLTEKPGSLVITSQEGDIYGSRNDVKNILLQSANTDWTIDTKVVYSRMLFDSENAGIVAYQDDDNFVRFTHLGRSVGVSRFAGGGQQAQLPGSLELVVEAEGNQVLLVSTAISEPLKEENTIFLRLVKKGDRYTAYYSLDGRRFTEAGSVSATLKDIEAGLIVSNGHRPIPLPPIGRAVPAPLVPPADALKASFDYFKISNSGLK